MSRKRRSFSVRTESDSSNDSVPTKKNAVWDPYCWLCHQSDTDRHCKTCIRSYHSHCIDQEEDKHNPIDYRCELCVRVDAAKEDYKKRNVDIDQLHEMLAFISNSLSKDEQFSQFGSRFSGLRQPVMAGPPIINPFDLSIVSEKVEETMYKTTLEFLNDIQWIRHNAEIVLKKTDKRLSLARDMEQLCAKEIYDIEMCETCFHRANTEERWFTQVCDPPHLLIWAKMKGHPYWPAKVIGNIVKEKVDVRFFGGHEMWNVRLSNCLLFTKKSPNKNLNDDEINDFKAAMKEAEEYKLNLEDKYSCNLLLARTKTPFDVNKTGEYLKKMIPGFVAFHGEKNFTVKRKPNYLQSLDRAEMVSALHSVDSDESEEQLKEQIKECTVQLTRCDNLMTKEQLQELKGDCLVEDVIDDKSEEFDVSNGQLGEAKEGQDEQVIEEVEQTEEEEQTEKREEEQTEEQEEEQTEEQEEEHPEEIEEEQQEDKDKNHPDEPSMDQEDEQLKDQSEEHTKGQSEEQSKDQEKEEPMEQEEEQSKDQEEQSKDQEEQSKDQEEEQSTEQPVKHPESQNPTRSMEHYLDKMKEEIDLRKDFPEQERILRSIQQMKMFELVVNLDSEDEEESYSGCYVISSDSSDDEVVQVDDSSDEKELTVHKTPDQRTYAKLKQLNASDDDIAIVTQVIPTVTEEQMFARKSYKSPHTFNFARRRSASCLTSEESESNDTQTESSEAVKEITTCDSNPVQALSNNAEINNSDSELADILQVQFNPTRAEPIEASKSSEDRSQENQTEQQNDSQNIPNTAREDAPEREVETTRGVEPACIDEVPKANEKSDASSGEENAQNTSDTIEMLREQVKQLQRMLDEKNQRIIELESRQMVHSQVAQNKELCIVCKKDANEFIMKNFNPPACSLTCLRSLCLQYTEEENSDENGQLPSQADG